jgi:diguanylate cyclase (GGDEF)-like protein
MTFMPFSLAAKRIWQNWADALERADVRVAQSCSIVLNLPYFLFGNLTGALITTVTLIDTYPRAGLLPVGLMAPTLLPLFLSYRKLRGASPPKAVSRRRIISIIAYSGYMGCLWAGLAIAFLPGASSDETGLLLTAACFLAVAGAAVLSIIPQASLAFVLPICAATLYVALASPAPFKWSLLLVSVGALVTVLWLTVSSWQSLMRVFDMAEERRILAATLEREIRVQRDLLAQKTEAERALSENRASLAQQSSILQTTLDWMAQGILMIDADNKVVVYNRRVVELLELPEEMLARRPSLAEILAYQTERGEFEGCDESFVRFVASGGIVNEPQTYQRKRANGVYLEVQSVPLQNGGIVRTVADITERKQAEEHLRLLAHYDALTELENRVVFHERLASAVSAFSESGSFSVLYIDLDGFKDVNDKLGHHAGDEMLCLVAQRMRRLVRGDDVVARLGGDEFAVLQMAGGDEAPPHALAQRLLDSVSSPYEIGGVTVQIGASIGIAVFPADGESGDQLLRGADLALYQAKKLGGNRFCRALRQPGLAV